MLTPRRPEGDDQGELLHTTIIRSDAPITVNAGDGDGHWFRMFSAIVESGAWARLSGSAAKIIVVLAETVNDEIRRKRGEWLAWPSITAIMQRTGLKRAIVYRSIAELEAAGMLKRRTSGSGTTTTTYQLIEPRGVYDGRPVYGRGREGSTGARARGLPQWTQSRLIEVDRTTTTAARGQRRAVAAAGCEDESLKTALVLAEIAEPTLSELVALPGLTPAIVERITRDTRQRGRGTGAIVNALRAAAAAAEKRKAKTTTRASTTRAKDDDVQTVERERRAVRAFIDSLDDDELNEHVTAVLAEMHDGPAKRRLSSADPRTSTTLAAAVYQRAAGTR